jgi:hypothetical protein
MGAGRARQIRSYLEQRIAAALEWYAGCACCTETLQNVKRDLDSVLAETCEKFGIDRMPFLLKVRFEGTQIVVSAVTRDLS